MESYDIPVVLFIFRRLKAVEIINRIAQVRPKKLYLIGDEGRNEAEKAEVLNCRKMVEQAINWECEIIKHYAQQNRGVYKNIGEGAKWVFERESKAVFLEDDNLPEISFFQYCKELLSLYEKDLRVLWVCGTNYLGKYKNENQDSYMFTKHLLPCGWASWSHKFNTFYDGDLKLCSDKNLVNRLKFEYRTKELYKQYSEKWLAEYNRIVQGNQPLSWDYQMDFAIKANGFLGISPCNNQIKNIGVDDISEHGGNSFKKVMTKRFCSMGSYNLEFPLKHPITVLQDREYERLIGNIMTVPFYIRFKNYIYSIKWLKKIYRTFFKKRNKGKA